MPITINEVAKEAGVSITTVSRVLNNNYPVKKETRERIEKAIDKLNYRPNIMARGLITKRTSVIGIVVPGITNLFFSTIVEEIQSIIKKHGYSIFLCNTGGAAKEEKDLVEDIICRQADGIIIIDPAIDNIEEGYYKEVGTRLPIVIINSSSENNEFNSICYDEKVGLVEGFEYLRSLNHEKILFIRGEKSLAYEIREKIYNNTIEKYNLLYKKVLRVGGGNSIEVVEETEKQLMNIFNEPNRPTAIFACNDLMALGAMKICRKLNIRIPEDLSIISVDNTLLAQTTSPRLTSVDFGMSNIAIVSAEEILEKVSKTSKLRNEITKKIFSTKLIKGESCAMARNMDVKDKVSLKLKKMAFN